MVYLKSSLAVAFAATAGAVVCVLVVTRDLAATDKVFKVGVIEAEKVDATTKRALRAGDELPAAQAAIGVGLPETIQVIATLNNAKAVLATLGGQLASIGDVLQSADAPLATTIAGADNSELIVNTAAEPAENIVSQLAVSNQRAQDLAPLLDETLARSQGIESKLRVLLLLPAN
ncbi:MAG: hypothetical protein ACT4PW_00370 [Acidimicrobiia bacterium]